MKKTGSDFGLPSGLIIFILLMISCQKDTSLNKKSTPVNNLGFVYFSDKTIEIDQAILVYDSTRIRDSLDFAVTPTDKYYEWTAKSENGCDALISNHLPMTDFIFHCAGNYQLSAEIYSDSTKHLLVGHTDTLEIQVTPDTLHRTQVIQNNDILNITPGIVQVESADPNINQSEIYIQLVLTTTNLYEYSTPYIQFDYATAIGPNAYTYQFSDSIRLESFPFAFGNGIKSIVDGAVDLHGLNFGVPAKLTIVWLDKTYEGTITLLNQNQWTTNWDNSGSVKMKY